MTSALAIKQDYALEFSQERTAYIRKHYAPGADDIEFEHFLGVCKARRLNPELKQIYFIKFPDRKNGGHTVSIIASIEGYRLIAHRTGVYLGCSEPKFEYNGTTKKYPISCSITVRKLVGSQIAEFTSIVFAEEQQNFSGQKSIWEKGPCRMLSKCAEAQALRMAFPQDLSGLYIQEEMPTEDPIRVSSDEEPAAELHEPIFRKKDAARVAGLFKKLAELGVPEDQRMSIASALDGTPDSQLGGKLKKLINALAKEAQG